MGRSRCCCNPDDAMPPSQKNAPGARWDDGTPIEENAPMLA
jgi:hypothetical protein